MQTTETAVELQIEQNATQEEDAGDNDQAEPSEAVSADEENNETGDAGKKKKEKKKDKKEKKKDKKNKSEEDEEEPAVEAVGLLSGDEEEKGTDDAGKGGKKEKKGKKKKVKQKKKMRRLIREIADTCDDQDGFDIYQWNAFAHWVYRNADGFVKKTNDEGRANMKRASSADGDDDEEDDEEPEDVIVPVTGLYYAFYMFQALITGFLQTGGLIILFYRIIEQGSQEKAWCAMDGAVDGKLVVGAFAYYVGFTVDAYIQSIKSAGMYAFFAMMKDPAFAKPGRSAYENVPFFVDTTWVNIGYIINSFALFVALYLSYFIIFFSESTFDVILNSVAVFFILEIDDLMITDTKYERVEALINTLREKEGGKIIVPEEFHDLGDSKEPACKCVLIGIRACIGIIAVISKFIIFIAPIVMAVCF